MKRSIAVLALFAVLFVSTGCSHNSGFSVLGVSAGVNSHVHAWEAPHLTVDLKSNPISSELGMGFVTVGSNAGLMTGDDWLSFSCKVGPSEVIPDAG